MFELLIAGGWVMLPILICSILAFAIIVERFWCLRTSKIAPQYMVDRIIHGLEKQQLRLSQVKQLCRETPLGILINAGFISDNEKASLSTIKLRMEDAGRLVILKLEKYLNFLGTIAAIAPLLGLLGTVMGMIEVFSVINMNGIGSSEELAGGIAEALLTTAFGLLVAIPSMMFYRFFQRKIDELALLLEHQSLQLAERLEQFPK